jgi:hypothetical protein
VRAGIIEKKVTIVSGVPTILELDPVTFRRIRLMSLSPERRRLIVDYCCGARKKVDAR